jgi:hypothetical protein
MKVLTFILIPILSLSLRIAIIGNVKNLSSVEDFLTSKGYQVLNSEELENLARKLSNGNPSILHYAFAAKMMSLDQVYFFELKEGVLSVRVLDVKRAEVYDLFSSDMNGKTVLEVFKEEMGKRAEGYPQISISLEKWKDIRIYGKGDIVKKDGKTYVAKKFTSQTLEILPQIRISGKK